jgi:hypothetical protein
MEKIICIGNQSEDTCVRAHDIARQFNLPVNGLITDNINSPGMWYTDLGSISVENFLFLGECADAVIVLDQPMDTYDCAETFHTTRGWSQYLSKFTRVIFENRFKDIYITTNLVPPNRYNSVLHRVKNNAEIQKIVAELDIDHCRLFVEFGTVDNVEQFENQLNTVVERARDSCASLVIFRASAHEIPESLHQLVTYKLSHCPEFVTMTPGVFNNNYHSNIQRLLENHWQMLYGKSPKNYHKAYTNL